MKLSEVRLLRVVQKAIQTIPFPTYGLKGPAGLAAYTADMRIATPLIREVLNNLLWNHPADANAAANQLDAWLDKRIAEDWT